MRGPYDVDRHVRQVLERQRRRPRVLAPAEQLSLFDVPEVRLRPPPVPQMTADGLVVDEDMLFARRVCLHSATKAIAAREYADIVGTAMGKRWKLWWIELFAGPGKLYVKETGDFVQGSPLEALGIRRPFDGYVFSDLAKPCVESLRRRIGMQPNVHVLEGDANSTDLLDQIASIVPRKNTLVVLYGDPEGLDLNWKTLEFFIDRYKHLDLLLNLPVTGIVRAVAAGYESKAASMLDYGAPRELIEPIGPKGALVRDWYQRRLAAAGFDQIHGMTVKLHGRNRELYDILLASRHPLAKKFFEAATDSAYKRVAS
jgi:three-Cys-motif partner protein